MPMVVIVHNLLVLQYPITPIVLIFRPLYNLLHNSRRLLVPNMYRVSVVGSSDKDGGFGANGLT